MFRKTKRIISMILVLTLMLSTLASCKKSVDKKEEGNEIESGFSRGSWVTMLAETFGMDKYDNEKPYYNDVNTNSPMFAYVQSSYEWGVLSKNSKEFKPNSPATLGFVVSTAVLAADLDYLTYSGDSDNEKIIKCAAEWGICEGITYDKEVLSAQIDETSASVILLAAQQAYINKPCDEHCEVELKSDVVDLQMSDVKVTNIETGDCVVSGDTASKLAVGKVFVEPASPEFPCGRAVKVVSMTINEDGTYTVITEEPELEEVFENIDIETSNIGEVTPEMVFCEEGVELESISYVDEQPIASQVAYVMPNAQAKKMADVSFGGKWISLKFKFQKSDGKPKLKADLNKPELEADLENIKDLFPFRLLSGSGNIKFYDDSLEEEPPTIIIEKYPIKEPTMKDLEGKNWTLLGSDKDIALAVLKDLRSRDYIDEFENEEQKLRKKYYGDNKNKELTKEEKAALASEIKEKSNEILKGFKTFKPTYDRYSYGYEIGGSVELRIKAKISAKVSWGKIKKVVITPLAELNTEYRIEGKFEGVMELAKFHIPFGASGFEVVGAVIIQVQANGEIVVSCPLSVGFVFEFKDGKSKTTYNPPAIDPNIDCQAEVYLGAGICCTPRVLGLKIVDISLTGGIKMNIDAKFQLKYDIDTNSEDGMAVDAILDVAIKSSVTGPIIRFEFGGKNTVLGKLKIKGKFDIDEYAKDLGSIKVNFPEKKIFTFYFDDDVDEEKSSNISEKQNETVNYYNIDQYLINMNVGEKYEINRESISNGYVNKAILFDNSNKDVVTVDSKGCIVAIKEGDAVITIICDEEVIGSIKIHVL
ncbi:MAG TPA: hypothetical protein DEO82_04435 [Eubacterium sp.]|nr:hypothetical protein [Eubacterium sp.]